MMFQYRAFGLNIQSGIEYPEFYPTNFSGVPDICLSHFEMNQDWEQAIQEIKSKSDKPDKYFFYVVKQLAAYEISDGKFINVYVASSAAPAAVRLYCLSNAFAAILYQRDRIPLHAAAICIKDGLALFLGDSGAGKSTLLLYLKSLGYPVFSDDVCVPFHDSEDAQVKVYASYPMLKCWSSTMTMLGLEDQLCHPLIPGMEKFGIYFHESFELQSKPPKFIFFLEHSKDSGEVDISSISGVEIFSRLVAQAYRNHHLESGEYSEQVFDVFSRLSQQVKAFVIRRPLGEETFRFIGQKVVEQILL